jgi:hypothetical protein
MELADKLLSRKVQSSTYYSQIAMDLKCCRSWSNIESSKNKLFQNWFDWALKQFKELKSASSQLIANDALEYFFID